jgi:hypothetical protein
MNTLLKLGSLSLLCVLALSSNVQAKSCFNSDKIDVKWVSYKTLAKIGVSGNFSKVDLKITNKDAKDVQTLLTSARLDISLDAIDAHMDLKNSNIAKFFTALLDDKEIKTKIISATEKNLQLEVTLNGTTQTIPMSYESTESKVTAKGVIDGLDFGLTKALKSLNINVSGHKKKGWSDISISFEMDVSSECK